MSQAILLLSLKIYLLINNSEVPSSMVKTSHYIVYIVRGYYYKDIISKEGTPTKSYVVRQKKDSYKVQFRSSIRYKEKTVT